MKRYLRQRIKNKNDKNNIIRKRGNIMKVIYNDGTVGECSEEEKLHVLRHSAAHIMAQAIQRLYPHADFRY